MSITSAWKVNFPEGEKKNKKKKEKKMWLFSCGK